MQKKLIRCLLALVLCFACSCSQQEREESKTKAEISAPTASSERIFGSGRRFTITNHNSTESGSQCYLFSDSDNQEIIAENYRWSGDSEWYAIDIDSDGSFELICNDQYDDGAERVSVFRDRNGEIEKGFISEEFITSLIGIEQITIPSNLIEMFDSNTSTIVIVYDDGVGKRVEKSVDFTNIEYLDFSAYIYLE